MNDPYMPITSPVVERTKVAGDKKEELASYYVCSNVVTLILAFGVRIKACHNSKPIKGKRLNKNISIRRCHCNPEVQAGSRSWANPVTWAL